MKIHVTRKIIYIGIGVGYLIFCAFVYFLWEVVFALGRPLLWTLVTGILVLIGGGLVTYWLKVSAKIEPDTKEKRQEIERKKRVLSSIKSFKNYLLPWLFDYACALSGRFLHYDNNRIYTGKWKDDIPQLEDIFDIAVFRKNGKRLRGTDKAETIRDEMLKHPLAPQFLYGQLNYGLRELEQVEALIREFPSLLDEVDRNVAKIVRLSPLIKDRIAGLQKWEKEHDKKGINVIDGSMSNIAIRSNLKSIGRSALDVVIAIDANIEKLEGEL